MRGIQYPRGSRRAQSAARAVRPLGDIAIASILVAITLPLMIIVAASIKCETRGPALVRRARIASNGRRFQALEFRTSLHCSGKNAAAGWRQDWTRVGLFLYNSRLNTLPQLLNVLRGDMPLTDLELYSMF